MVQLGETSPRSPHDPLWKRIRGAVQRRVARARKMRWQRRNLDPALERRPVFLVGCQRSGTNMFHRVVAESPHALIYNEDARPAFVDYRLREPEVIERLIRKSPAPLVLFKPLCDSHLIDQILDRYPGSRAVWMFRDYRDVVNSMIHMWGDHQRDTICRIVNGRWDELGWRGERIAPQVRETIARVYRDDLTAHEGGVLTWYLRNHFFFALDLEHDPRVHMVRYEVAVRDVAAAFRDVFAFMGFPFSPAFASQVSPRSIEKEPFPEIAPEIAALGDEMLAALVAAFERQSRPGASPDPMTSHSS